MVKYILAVSALLSSCSFSSGPQVGECYWLNLTLHGDHVIEQRDMRVKITKRKEYGADFVSLENSRIGGYADFSYWTRRTDCE